MKRKPARALPPLPPAIYVDTDEKLRRCVAEIAAQMRVNGAGNSKPLIGVDTESNSLYAYRERVCLIQLSTRAKDYIVDPQRVRDLELLRPLLADAAIEKVFHAAEYDLMCLKRDYGFEVRGLFDTMVAARICGYKNIGLGSLLSEIAGIEMDKSHQRDDWGQRPLPASSLLYAQMDTHYLPILRDFFAERLTELNRWDEAQEAFEELVKAPPARAHVFDPEGYWRIALPNNLTRRQAAVLRELYLTRDRLAEARDLPPFKVLTDKALVAIVHALPMTLEQLEWLEGIGSATVRRYGRELLDAVKRGMNARPPQPPAQDPPAHPTVVERYTALREWRKARADERGVESDVIISREALWAIAVKAPETPEDMDDIPGFGPWRRAAYAEEIIEVIKRVKQE